MEKETTEAWLEQVKADSEMTLSFLLTQRGDVCYAALLSEESGLDPEQLRARFSFISLDLLPENEN